MKIQVYFEHTLGVEDGYINLQKWDWKQVQVSLYQQEIAGSSLFSPILGNENFLVERNNYLFTKQI